MVYVYVAEGFEEIEAVTIVDVLRRAGIETKMVSISGEKTVCGAHGIPVVTDLLFDEADYSRCEMMVLPGGMPGTTNLMAHEGLASAILSFFEKNKYLAAICAAPMIFGKLGILKGKNAVIFPGMEENLIGAAVGTDRVVQDGTILTSKGPGTAMEFAFAIAGVLKSAEEAAALAHSMVVS